MKTGFFYLFNYSPNYHHLPSLLPNLTKKNILGETAVNPIKKENLIFPKEGELKYFYEPKPNNPFLFSKNPQLLVLGFQQLVRL